MSTFSQKVTSAVAGLAVVFSMVAPIAGVSAAYNAADAADKLATLGVIVDHSANKAGYRLADTTSRQELSKIIVKLGGLEVKEGESVFKDTNFASWAEKYAKALNEAGYAASNEYFNPTYNATKIEALKWVMDARGIENGTGDNWMANRVQGAVDAGIATAFTDYNADVSRGQVFIWAANAIEAKDDTTVDETLCSILGTCPTEPTEPTKPTEPTAPTTGGDVEITLSPLSPTSGRVAAGKDRTPIVAFDVTAGSSDVTLRELTLGYVGLSKAADFDKLKVYQGNKQVTKQDSRKFKSDRTADLRFENGTVVQAGETVTFMVTANISDDETNSAHQVKVLSVETSADVTLGNVTSVVFDTVDASNTATLKVSADERSGKVQVGKVETLADVNLEAKDDEDVMLKSMTFEFGGQVDAEDDIANLALYADGVEVASDLMVNSDDEVIIDMDYTVKADDDVDFELRGVVTGSIGLGASYFTVEMTELYAIGADTGVIASLTGSDAPNHEVANFGEVRGSKINVSFTKSSVDEAKPDADDVLVGTLKINPTSDYNVDELLVHVESTAGSASGVLQILEDLELDGDTAEAIYNYGTTTVAVAANTHVTYKFTDISLTAGLQKVLDLKAQVNDNVNLNGQDLEFVVEFQKVEDIDNDETFTKGVGGAFDITKVLSSNSFDAKKLGIETASFTLTQTNLTQRDLVLGNSIEVVLYQGKLTVADSDAITLEKMTFNGVHTGAGYDFEDIISQAKLNIGGRTETETPEATKIEFTGLDMEIPAGDKNVDVLLTATLKDNASVSNGDEFYFTLVNAGIVAKDSNRDVLATGQKTINPSANTVVQMQERGTLALNIDNNTEYKNDITDVVLAGSNGVALAGVSLEAEEENVKVEKLVFAISGSGAHEGTFADVRIMKGSTVVADGASITQSGANLVNVEFDDFTVEDTGKEIEALLVADLNIITTAGGVATAKAGALEVTIVSGVEARGESSNDSLQDYPGALTVGAATSDEVTVVPALVTLSSDNTFSEGDTVAALRVTIDKGSNYLTNDDVTALTMKLSNYGGLVSEIINVDNNDAVLYSSISGSLVGSETGNVITFGTGTDSEINNGDRLEVRLDDSTLTDGDTRLMEVERGSNEGFVYTINSVDYNVTNESRTSLGSYKK